MNTTTSIMYRELTKLSWALAAPSQHWHDAFRRPEIFLLSRGELPLNRSRSFRQCTFSTIFRYPCPSVFVCRTCHVLAYKQTSQTGGVPHCGRRLRCNICFLVDTMLSCAFLSSSVSRIAHTRRYAVVWTAVFSASFNRKYFWNTRR